MIALDWVLIVAVPLTASVALGVWVRQGSTRHLVVAGIATLIALTVVEHLSRPPVYVTDGPFLW